MCAGYRIGGSAGFPGLSGPGLIEAQNQCLATGGVSRVFRGYLAPASLKLVLMLHINTQQPVFRGYLAPASLKLKMPAGFQALSRRFPGLSGPGLIEAP